MRTRHGLAAHSMTTHRQMEARKGGLEGERRDRNLPNSWMEEGGVGEIKDTCHEDTARPRCAQHDNASSDGSEKGGRGAPCSETRTSRDASEREDPPRAVEPSDDERADNLPRASPPGASSAPSRLPPPRGPPPPAGWRRSERHPGCAALIDATTFFWSALSKSESRSWLNMQSLPNAHLTPVVGSRYATQHGRAFWPFWPATL